MRHNTHFILNNQDVQTRASQGLLVLDYLREHAHLIGTKEGCREGDCGACTVLVGTLAHGKMNYLPVTSCLLPLGELHGKHLVSIEGLNGGELTPVQQAIVDEGASQCGFCTPGFVVSLTAMLMQDGDADVALGLSGNLCRCTGYRSLKAAAESVACPTDNRSLIADGHVPEYFDGIAARLSLIPPAPSVDEFDVDAPIIAGGTDIYVQRGASIPEAAVSLLNLSKVHDEIVINGESLQIGAGVTFQQLGENPDFISIMPSIGETMDLIASWQIRNRATIGGNIVNASPIADMTILFLALGADLTLEKAGKTRTIALSDFYHGYKQLDLAIGELVAYVTIPIPEASAKIHFEKTSKRRRLDIATVNSAVNLNVGDDGNIASALLAVGGVAPIPLTLAKTAEAVLGREVNRELLAAIMPIAQSEIAPISDVRGSADYKRLLVRQQLMLHFTTLFPESISSRELYATH